MPENGVSMEIKIQKNEILKRKPDEKDLGFGKIFTDHMFLMNYNLEEGWHDARIVPYNPISLDPSATCFHYGQLVFEGMKAYRTIDDEIVLFRPKDNFLRMNESNKRMCIPEINPDEVLEALCLLLNIEKDWIPNVQGTSLYIRPFVIATEAFLGVHPSNEYLFIIILSPVGSYYNGGLNPIKIYVEDQYVRSVKGGTGFVKCAGNYGAALISQQEAKQQGYDQVLWLDGITRKNIEEVGSTNIFFYIGGQVVTPKIDGSILAGITRKSVIELLKLWNIPVSERTISIDEIYEAYEAGKLKEAFGTGTAAVVSPIGELKYKDNTMTISCGHFGNLTNRIYNELTGIQRGTVHDCFNWIYRV